MAKKIPNFKNEKQEQEFWQKNDSTQYLDWKDSEEVVFPNLKPTTRSISIRLPENLIYALKLIANKRDVPYQSLLKIFLSERIYQETHPKEQKLTNKFKREVYTKKGIKKTKNINI